jgi:hypothetical protein
LPRRKSQPPVELPIEVAPTTPPAQDAVPHTVEPVHTPDAPPRPLTREPVEESPERGAPKPRTTLTYVVPDGTVSMVDDGNRGGLGVLFALGGRRPSPAVLEAVKGDRTFGQAVKRGLSWTHGQWRKRVGESPVGDRLEVEGRVKDAAERILAERENQVAGRDPL